ncbi:MAG: aminopeptidase P family protein [Pseudomonadota bacterium]
MFQTFDPVSDRSFASKHVPLLRAKLDSLGLDGFIIPHEDEYQNEYIPACAERLLWITGFSGSAGSAIVLRDKAAAFSDGRYAEQLPQQVDDAIFECIMLHDTSPAAWLENHAARNARVGYDPLLHSEDSVASLQKAADRGGFTLVPTRPNPIDEVWPDQPGIPLEPISPHPLSYAGEDSRSKRQTLAAELVKKGADAALLTSPTSIAWLFNIRGGDVHASPLPLSRAVLEATGNAILFVHTQKVSEDVKSHLGDDVTIRPENDIEEYLQQLGRSGKCVLIDPKLTPVHYGQLLEDHGAQILKGDDPAALPRAIKNETEQQGARDAQIRDGAAMVRFLHWLSQNAPSGTVTEISAAQKLESFRRETGALQDVSFDTISGSAAHGAIVHYRVTTETDRRLQPGELYLIDSGGQYKDGTTDITRVVAVGEPSSEMRENYTSVLQGHINLTLARFPKGTTGHQLDSLARFPLWQRGLDYDHGTGHGVGSYLGVHEGPQNISKRMISQPLEPGMICSNEPGYYKPGHYGIRLENLILVTEPTTIPGGDRPMMGFENLTWVPFERELIEFDRLSPREQRWLDDYHAQVLEKIGPLVSEEELAWLKERCKSFA